MTAIEAHGPGVAISIGGARLVREPGPDEVGRRGAGENVGHMPGSASIKQLHVGSTWRWTDAVLERHRPAFIGEAGIKRDQIAKRQAYAAKADGQARRPLRRHLRPNARNAKPRHQALRADGVKKPRLPAH
jgi:hypothetical protein